MEKKFKKGDRVRFIGDCVYQGVSYDEFIVTEDSDDKRTDVERYVYEELCFGNDELELVESFDPKTAFLQDLKELLIKYDAQIRDYEEYCVEIRIGDEWLSWYNKEKISGQSEGISPSNIFDYDK